MVNFSVFFTGFISNGYIKALYFYFWYFVLFAKTDLQVYRIVSLYSFVYRIWSIYKICYRDLSDTLCNGFTFLFLLRSSLSFLLRFVFLFCYVSSFFVTFRLSILLRFAFLFFVTFRLLFLLRFVFLFCCVSSFYYLLRFVFLLFVTFRLSLICYVSSS